MGGLDVALADLAGKLPGDGTGHRFHTDQTGYSRQCPEQGRIGYGTFDELQGQFGGRHAANMPGRQLLHCLAYTQFFNRAAGRDQGTRIPVSVINGLRAGPVLALIAGTHGYEYPGITALQRLRQQVSAEELAGALILVHLANPPAFYGRSIYKTPADGKNLNRVYPGKPDGSVSERIADSITRAVIEQADYLVDLHAGDGNEALRPYVYMPVTGNPELDAASRGMAPVCRSG